MQGIRDAVIEDLLDSARVGRSLRRRPSPAKHHSSLAQPSAALPRDVAGEAALARGSLEEKRAHTWVPRSSDGLEANKRTRQTEWRKPRTENEQSHGGSRRPATLAHGCGQYRSNHRISEFQGARACLFFLRASLVGYPYFACFLWCSSRLPCLTTRQLVTFLVVTMKSITVS